MKNKTEFKIEKGIPIPKGSGRGARGKYPWEKMKVGDSFYVEKNGNTMHTAARSWSTRRSLKHKWATTKEGAGYRIWRIK